LLNDGTHLVLEAKGLVDVDVPRKDARAQRWASEASAATGIKWRYFRIDEELVAIMDQTIARGEVTGVDEAIRRFREDPRGR